MIKISGNKYMQLFCKIQQSMAKKLTQTIKKIKNVNHN